MAMPDCDRDKLTTALDSIDLSEPIYGHSPSGHPIPLPFYLLNQDDRDTLVTQTRLLLAEIERLRETIKAATEAMQEEQRDLWASADMDDEHGAHVGLARHARTVAEGIGRGEAALTRAYKARFPDA